MKKYLANPGRINKPAIFFGGILLAISVVAGVSWWRINRVIKKGKVVLDVTDQLPTNIQDLIHASGWLPKKIPIQIILQTGDPKLKGKARGIIAMLSKYFSVKLEEV